MSSSIRGYGMTWFTLKSVEQEGQFWAPIHQNLLLHASLDEKCSDVLQNILETENEYFKEIQNLLANYLRHLQTSEKLNLTSISYLMGNVEEICSFQQLLVQTLEDCTNIGRYPKNIGYRRYRYPIPIQVNGTSSIGRLPEGQQRVGGCFMSLMNQMKSLYMAYCANHPSAVNVLTQHSEELGEFMEMKGANSPGILVLTTGLSKPFMRLDKYPTLLKELERHMEQLDEGAMALRVLQRLPGTAVSDFCVDYAYHGSGAGVLCSALLRAEDSTAVRRRRKGNIGGLSTALQNAVDKPLMPDYHPDRPDIQKSMTAFKNLSEKNERYLLLFPNALLMLSASPRMSGFIYQGKLPLTGTCITKLEDNENHKNAYEISGNMIERITVSCNNQQDLQEWVDHLHKQTKFTSMTTPTIKPHSVPCHTLPSHPVTPSSKHSDCKPAPHTPAYHTLPHLSHHGTPHSINWSPLEPPKTSKPWSLSCLRPAPPLRPSAALCYKERMSCILKDLSKSPKTMKKLLPKRKPERKPSDEEFALRKSTAALEEDAQILKVIEAYCTSAKTRQTLNSTWQGTDLMHNHVLADDDQSSLDSLGRRSSLSRLEPSDLSEDSDYDSIWTAHSYRMGSTSRKSCCSYISHQN
ncbi:unnamed protein product [Ranitomeya imitator]|uniref:Rho guanine nucleotide exchange factor 7 n=1 Tax=Ranitomeya imitator TaxID=111125 RepID=A0ABN9LTM4_9NEOB|nr:unnamed protein product [Ranitomeya imitator]